MRHSRDIDLKEPTAAALGAQSHPASRLQGIDRVRLAATVCVVAGHAAYPSGSPVLSASPVEWRQAATVFAHLVGGFPVNAFVLLSFLLLEPKLSIATGAPGWLRIVGRRLSRLAPAYLFWTALYAGLRVLSGARPAPGEWGRVILLGTAATHLYYVPLLLALTAAYPAASWLARRPLRALAGGVGSALAASQLYRALPPGSPWLGSALGIAGVFPYAVAGIALARSWGGQEPPARLRGPTLAAGLGLLLLGGVLVVRHALAEATAGVPLPYGVARWAGGVVYSVGVPLCLLVLPLRIPRRLERVVALSFGIYLAHPLVVRALKAAEAAIPPLHGWPLLLVIPNALLAFAVTTVAVAAGMRTPLRRVLE